MPDRWAALTRVEWGTLLGAVTAACGALWKWLTNRRRAQVELEKDLDDSRIGVETQSWRIQRNVGTYLERRVERLVKDAEKAFQEIGELRAHVTRLQGEHEDCERTTSRLMRQNKEQAEQIASLQEQLASLRGEKGLL
jgi:chromosome segregation ATPase